MWFFFFSPENDTVLGEEAVDVTCLFWGFFSVQTMDEENEMLLEYKLKKVVLLVLCLRSNSLNMLWLFS